MPPQRYDEQFTAQDPWLDLVNSQQWDGFGQETDHLHDGAWVKRYLDYWPALKSTLAAASAPRQLRPLRETLRNIATRNAQDLALRKADVAALNEFLAAPGHLQLSLKSRSLTLNLVPVRGNWAWIRSQVVRFFIDACLSDIRRIKRCQNDLCQWVFFDTTKSNNRRWCHDRRCGNRDRVRRARARQSTP